ncbi:MAG: amidase family protein, partial [Candidatus Marinimicrobia bacterium]|nr:amidase family protein [Candidatus Neomarinimicrobiota bacterium]
GNQTLITNLTGHPAISVPAGFDEKGRPTSIILVGNLYDETSILALAKKFQDATDFEDVRPPIFSGNPIE